MAWAHLNSFSNSMAGKKVRFRSNHPTANLSYQFDINKTHPAQLNIPAGAIGVIYQVRGSTLFIGFGRDLKVAPSSHGSATFYGATIQFYMDNINKLEIEN